MDQSTSRDTGLLLLRLCCGGLLLFHGVHKVFVEIDHVIALVQNAGLPGFLAYGNIIGEFVAPILVLLGWWTRTAAWIIVVNMLASVGIAHADISFSINDFGGWMIETNMLYMLSAAALALIGPGRFSIDERLAKT